MRGRHFLSCDFLSSLDFKTSKCSTVTFCPVTFCLVTFRPTFFWGSRSESFHNMHKLLSYHLHMKVVTPAWAWVVAIAKQVPVCVRVKVCQLLTVYMWICFPGLTTLIFWVRMCRYRVKIWTKFMCTRIEKCYPVYIAHFIIHNN
jgi:hypothetical protein